MDAFDDTGYFYDIDNWDGNDTESGTDLVLYIGKHLICAYSSYSGECEIKEGTITIADNAFGGCEGLTKVVLPSSVKRIGIESFSYCKNMKHINLTDSITEIDDYAFFSCDELDNIILPSSIEKYGEGVFSYCCTLQSIYAAPDCDILSSDDNGVLYNKDKTILIQYPIGKETETYSISDSVIKVGPYSFAGSDNLSQINFPDSLEEIGNGAFEVNSSLSSVEIPDSIQIIGEYVFGDAESLTNIKLPEKVFTINEKAFYNTAYNKDSENHTDGVLYIGKHIIRGFPELSGDYKIKDGTLTIAGGAFRNCKDLQGIIFPKSMNEVGDYAFYSCEALKSVYIPESVTKIGQEAFGIYYDIEEGNKIVSGFSVRGKSGSEAERYASLYDIPFEKVVIQIENGMAQETIEYSDPLKEDYSNSDSTILRFSVYVETDHDTDLDGKPDLVKTLVQVPRSAADGEYKAPVIYEASPYIAGTNWGDLRLDNNDTFDESLLHTKPEKRKVSGLATSFDAADAAKKEDWSYGFSDPDDYMGDDGIKNLKDYDYFLVRGFAVVLSAGPGTYGSEGIECSGSVMERDAFKCVAEWLHGDRKAFTDKENNIEIQADWSSGKIGMIGFSYSATMAYEVATTGVQGVETIVDNSGISSWYDYVNSQGICTNFNIQYDYMSMLNLTCASRFFKDYDEDAKLVNEKYLY